MGSVFGWDEFLSREPVVGVGRAVGVVSRLAAVLVCERSAAEFCDCRFMRAVSLPS